MDSEWNFLVKLSFFAQYFLWLRYHILIFLSTCVNIRADSEYISAESALFNAGNQIFQSKEKQRWTVLIQSWFSLKQRCSELISNEFFSSEQRCFREHQSWSALKERWRALMFFMVSESALSSPGNRQISETAMLSTEYLWDFNMGKGFESQFSPIFLLHWYYGNENCLLYSTGSFSFCRSFSVEKTFRKKICNSKVYFSPFSKNCPCATLTCCCKFAYYI